jgi:hypothetical protein
VLLVTVVVPVNPPDAKVITSPTNGTPVGVKNPMLDVVMAIVERLEVVVEKNTFTGVVNENGWRLDTLTDIADGNTVATLAVNGRP